MTDYQFQTAAPQYSPPPRNGLGTAGFVLGLLALISSPIPIAGMVAFPLGLVGLILSIVGVSRANKRIATNKGLAIAGIILAVLGLIVAAVWTFLIGKAISDVQDQVTAQHTVVYEISGDAKGVDVQYTTFSEHTLLIEGDTAATLPWTKTVQAKGFLDGGQFVATAGDDGGKVTCKVTVDGKVMKTATASGPHAVATCSGF